MFEAIGKIAREHDDAICTALNSEEREMLGALLGRIADQQGLTPGVHPGFSRLGRSSAEDDEKETPRSSRRKPT